MERKDKPMNAANALKMENKSDCLWITLPDSINMDTYQNIEAAITSRLREKGPRVVLDMSKTSNLFSSGLGLMIRIRKQVCENQGYIFLVNVSQKVRKILETVRLDKVFTLYATDVEFEISQDELFQKHISGGPVTFVFINGIEKGAYRIHLSGHMTVEQDLSAIKGFAPEPAVKNHVFDLTGLDMIDSAGAGILIKLFMGIQRRGGASVAYGVNDAIAGLFDILGIGEYVRFSGDERDALKSIGTV